MLPMPFSRAPDSVSPRVRVVGGGPAGLMAAEVIAAAGISVDLYDAMPSVGRKFLMAGRGGLNITHAEPVDRFRGRYGTRADLLAPALDAFGARDLQSWMADLGIASFVGSSGRVFPEGMKAAPLLRAWLHRLRSAGVRFHVRHRWLGWDLGGALRFDTPDGERTVAVGPGEPVVLALGGGSWAKLGSNGAWVGILAAAGVDVAPLRPANCGFDVAWSDYFCERFAGTPVKNVAARAGNAAGQSGAWRAGEFVITAHGVEGGLVYALSADLRDEIERCGQATLIVDLLPGRDPAWVFAEASHPRGSRSLSSHLQGRLGIKDVKLSLLHECLPKAALADPSALAAAIKALPVPLRAARPLDEAISSAGGVRFGELNDNLMLRTHPGVFCAGEMLDWEAPTGGYLLTACFATGRHAGQGVLDWLRGNGMPGRSAGR